MNSLLRCNALQIICLDKLNDMRIEAGSICLIPIEGKHYEWFYKELFSRQEVMALYRDGKGRTEKETIDFVNVRANRWKRSEPSGWVVYSHNEPVGYIGFGRIESNVKYLEAGYCFIKMVWGKGLGYASLALAMLWLKKSHHAFDYICATSDPENVASVRILVKSGFQFEREEIRHDYGGTKRNHYVIERDRINEDITVPDT
jgi:RimJ/RimL family protein N-acetyltransferase